MEPPFESRPGRFRSPLVLPEGVEAGLIGAVSVAAVFFAHDLWSGESMQNPSVLGTLLLSGVASVGTQGPVAGAAAFYHAFHFAAWIALGFAGSALMAYAERTRTLWLPPLAALLALMTLAVLDVYVRHVELERLHLWVGGLVGIVSMGAFLAWRHPDAVRSEAGEG